MRSYSVGALATSVPARVLLGVALTGQMALFPSPVPLTGRDWAFAVASSAVFVLAVRWPTWSAVAQALLVAAAVAVDAANAPAIMLAALSVGEVAYRRSAAQVAIAATALAVTFVYKLRVGDPGAPILITATRVAVVVAIPIAIGVLTRRIVQRSRDLEARVSAMEARREREIAVTREAERAALARELHDVVAHHVASIALSVGVAKSVARDLDPDVRVILDEVHRTSSVALTNLRSLMNVLRRSEMSTDFSPLLYADSDPAASLRQLIAELGADGVNVTADPAAGRVGSLETMAILRLVQEGAHNAREHGRPGEDIDVGITFEDNVIRVTISNPFDVATGTRHESVDRVSRSFDDDGPPARGHGLTGMRERVDIIGGSFAAGPNAGGDRWLVVAQIPVGAAAESFG